MRGLLNIASKMKSRGGEKTKVDGGDKRIVLLMENALNVREGRGVNKDNSNVWEGGEWRRERSGKSILKICII